MEDSKLFGDTDESVISFYITQFIIRLQMSVEYVRFKVLTAVDIKVMVFWDVTPYSSVEGYNMFEIICCLPLWGRRIIR